MLAGIWVSEMSRVFSHVYVTEPLGDNPKAYIEAASGFVSRLGDLLFTPAEMPEWAAEGHAIFMAAGVGFGGTYGSYLDNIKWTRLATELNTTELDAASLLARGFKAAGFDANAKVAEAAVTHLSAKPLSAARLAERSNFVDTPSALVDAMAAFLQDKLPYQVLSSDQIDERLNQAVNAVPDEVYWARANVVRQRLPQEMWPLLIDQKARLYGYQNARSWRVEVGVAGLERKGSGLSALFGSRERLSEHGRMGVYLIDSSRGEYHLVTYRDAIVLRSPDGVILGKRANPQTYNSGTPGSRFWTADEAPDWRLEEIDGGGWVAAY